MKKSLFLSLAMSLILSSFGVQPAIAAVPEVSWNHQVVDVSPQEGVCDHYVLDNLAGHIDKVVKGNATLPFTLHEKDESFGLQGEGFKSFIAMVPVIREDNCRALYLDLTWQGRTETYYKYVLRGQLDLVFCRFENGNINFLYDIPVFGTKTIGADVSENVTSPLTQEELQGHFIAMMTQEIDKALQVINPAVGRYLSERRLRTGTTQVTKVVVTSPMALNKLPEEVREDFKRTIAGAYTSAYISSHPKAIMLPDSVGGDKQWRQKVAANIQALAGIDKLDYVPDIDDEEECGPAKAITLDLNKLSTYQIPIKNSGLNQYYDYVGIAVGIKSSENQETLSSYERRFLRGSDIRTQLMSIFGSLMNDTAKELGRKK